MITFSKFGNYGRLGNQLFQYASMLGIANKYNTEVMLPRCDFYNYLENKPKIGDIMAAPVQEQHFHFDMEQFADAGKYNIDITGWLQSEKYWEHCREHVIEMLEFSRGHYEDIYDECRRFFEKRTIAISIRRGDYVDNPNYELLDADYYYLALLKHFPDWRDYNILIFSDDIPYCKVHFQCLPNVYFVEGLNPMEQLILGSQCDNFIIANSTFSWWMAYLGEKPNSKVIRPAYLFAGELLKANDDKDFYPERWEIFEHKQYKLDLRDVTFVIPVSFDSDDRKENFNAIRANLNSKFHRFTLYGEQGSSELLDMEVRNIVFFSIDKFHRTKMINDMTRFAHTPIVINYDCDILVPPLQIYLAVEMLRNGEADMVYPYDGRFARVPRSWMPTIKKYNDVGMFKDTEFVGCRPFDGASVGGVIAYNRDKFIESGGENEKMISYAPEDQERFYRWNKLGYKVHRIKGCCYHIDHVITTNSSTTHPDYQANEKEFDYVKSLTKEQLRTYVDGWRYFG